MKRNAQAPCRFLLVIACCAVLGSTRVAAQQPELSRLRALVVVDTRSGLGESVTLDGRRIQNLLRSGIPPGRLDLTVFDKASQLTRASILGYYRNLKTGPDEALFFYYAGHGATDPEKGLFLALQELHTAPLTRDELRQAMLRNRPGLAVILTDCCSSRYELKKKNRDVWDDEHRDVNPVLHDLLFRHRGLVDVTAATGNEAFGDEHQGGLFTRALGKLLLARPRDLDFNHDGFVNWKEFFPRLQQETESTFRTWAQQHRGSGEAIQQKSQRPRALHLPGDPAPVPDRLAVTIRNDLGRAVEYQYRWGNAEPWKSGKLAPHQSAAHLPPAAHSAAAAQLEVRSKEGSNTARPGSTLRFHD